LQGESGLFALMQAKNRVAELEIELAEVRAERIAIENRTRRLSDDYLDIDLLDERSRIVLGYARSDELLIE
jgi:cell division protein FtsB